MQTARGELIVGVEEGGAWHRAFVMREATVGDAIAAVDDAGPDASVLRIRVHKAARQLISLGDLPSEAITAELLLALPEEDLPPLFDAQDEVAKKPSRSRSPSAPSDGSKPSSGPTASTAPAN